MQLPITIELHRSRLQPRILALLLSVALIVVLFYPLPVPLRLIGVTLLALGGGWMVRQLRPQVAALQLLADGSLGIRGTGWNHPEFVQVRMLQGAHFLSHTLWTLWLAWAASVSLALAVRADLGLGDRRGA